MKNLIPALICLFLVIPCQAEIIYVDDDGPVDFNNIQAAIDESNAGDEIIVAEGTYVENINLNGKNITLRSTDPNDPNVVATTIIDGNDIGPVVTFYSGEDTNCVLSGFTIINGNGDLGVAGVGGGVYCAGSSPTISNCIISGNFASIGSGMFNWESNPTLLNCTFSGNSAMGGEIGTTGGGMCNVDSNSTLTNCTFSGNSASYGGGMLNWDSNPTLTNCTFSGNSAENYGGGMSIYNYLAASTLTLTNCTFAENSAMQGNALSCDSYEQSYPGTVQLANCILWDGGDEISNNDGSTITITYSDVQGGWLGIGNIDTNPCFVESGQWVDANDPNIIVEPNDPNAFWIDGDYHLKSEGWRWTEELIHDSHWYYDFMTSRCIDAGNPGSPLRDELMTVPDDPNNTWGENIRINMGAYGGTAEASMPPYDWAIWADLTNDGKVDYVDLVHWVENWLSYGSELPSDLNRNGVVDMVDFALFGQDWCLETIWHE